MKKIFDRQVKPFFSVIIFGLSNITFFSGFIMLIINNHFQGPIAISIAILIKRFARFTLDPVFGFLADKYGNKKIFALSIIFDIIALLLFLIEQKISIIIALFFHGLAHSCFHGKFEVYLYNCIANKLDAIELKNKIIKSPSRETYQYIIKPQKIQNNCTYMFRIYSKTLSLYYFLYDIISAFSAVLASEMLKTQYSYHLIIYVNIALKIIAIMQLFFVKGTIQNKTGQGKHCLLKKDTILRLFTKNNNLGYIIIFWAIINFFGWQFYDISKMLMLSMKLSNSSIAKICATESFAMTLGCIMSFFLAEKITLRVAMKMFIIIIFTLLCLSFLSSKLIIFGIILYIFSYATLETSVAFELENYSLTEIRNTVTAISTFITSILSILFTFLIGIFSEFIGYKITFSILYISFFTYSILIYRKVLKH
jgi:MFS family permease